MVKPTRPPANGFVKETRRLYNPLGFSKGYNFILFFIGAGYLMGFTLSRFQYFNFYGIFCNANSTTGSAAPGECYYYLQNPFKVGIVMHLAGILPATFLACFQFVPVIRHKVLIFHRMNGYIIVLLVLVSSAGVLIFLRHAFGGDVSTQTASGLMIIMTTLALAAAIYNIKRLQIDQHRAMMLRVWAYMASIVTTRLIMIISATIMTQMASYYVARPCYQLAFMMGPRRALRSYPDCQAYFNGTNEQQHVAVQALMSGGAAQPSGVAAALGASFGSSLWLAFALHAIGIEIYLRLTPAESDRLRQVSYERQSEAGFKNPGSAGLTAERFGDANPYQPPKRFSAASEELAPLSPSVAAKGSFNDRNGQQE